MSSLPGGGGPQEGPRSRGDGARRSGHAAGPRSGDRGPAGGAGCCV